MTDEPKPAIRMSIEEIKTMAKAVAEELKAASAGMPNDPVAATGGGSLHRKLPADLQKRFIDVRAALFQRGIFDPVLVRFDTASVTQASTQEIAEQLTQIADSLGV